MKNIAALVLLLFCAMPAWAGQELDHLTPLDPPVRPNDAVIKQIFVPAYAQDVRLRVVNFTPMADILNAAGTRGRDGRNYIFHDNIAEPYLTALRNKKPLDKIATNYCEAAISSSLENKLEFVWDAMLKQAREPGALVLDGGVLTYTSFTGEKPVAGETVDDSGPKLTGLHAIVTAIKNACLQRDAASMARLESQADTLIARLK